MGPSFLGQKEAEAVLHLIFMVVSSVTPGRHKIVLERKEKWYHCNSYFSEACFLDCMFVPFVITLSLVWP